MRSDTHPQNGENTSWAPEKAATRAAAMNDEAPNRFAYCGRIGRTIPNPTRSSATEDQIAPKPRGSGGRDPGTLTNERGTEAHVKSSLHVAIPGRSGTGSARLVPAPGRGVTCLKAPGPGHFTHHQGPLRQAVDEKENGPPMANFTT